MNNKKTIIGLLSIWLLVPAFSFDVGIFGYEISYHTPVQTEVIDYTSTSVETPVITEVQDYDYWIDYANSIGEVRATLMRLGYTSVGFTDTDTGVHYVVSISPDGIIRKVYLDDSIAEVETSGSLSRVKTYLNTGQYKLMRNEINVPLHVKLRLWLMYWWY